jgi:hypothetical protein
MLMKNYFAVNKFFVWLAIFEKVDSSISTSYKLEVTLDQYESSFNSSGSLIFCVDCQYEILSKFLL